MAYTVHCITLYLSLKNNYALYLQPASSELRFDSYIIKYSRESPLRKRPMLGSQKASWQEWPRDDTDEGEKGTAGLEKECKD